MSNTTNITNTNDLYAREDLLLLDRRIAIRNDRMHRSCIATCGCFGMMIIFFIIFGSALIINIRDKNDSGVKLNIIGLICGAMITVCGCLINIGVLCYEQYQVNRYYRNYQAGI